MSVAVGVIALPLFNTQMFLWAQKLNNVHLYLLKQIQTIKNLRQYMISISILFVWNIDSLLIHRVASGLEKSGKFDIFSRSGNCQGILKIGQWKIKILKSQGKVREFFLIRTHFSITSIGNGSLLALNISLTSILLWLFFILIKWNKYTYILNKITWRLKSFATLASRAY